METVVEAAALEPGDVIEVVEEVESEDEERVNAVDDAGEGEGSTTAGAGGERASEGGTEEEEEEDEEEDMWGTGVGFNTGDAKGV